MQPCQEDYKKTYLGRYSKHFGTLPTKKLYEKSAILSDKRQKPVDFAFEAYLNK
jgi:hypothetical protein